MALPPSPVLLTSLPVSHTLFRERGGAISPRDRVNGCGLTLCVAQAAVKKVKHEHKGEKSGKPHEKRAKTDAASASGTIKSDELATVVCMPKLAQLLVAPPCDAHMRPNVPKARRHASWKI